MDTLQKFKNKIMSIVKRDGENEQNGAIPAGIANQGYDPSELGDIRPPPLYSLKRMSFSGSGRKASVMERAPNIEHYRLDAATLGTTLSRPSLKDLHQEKVIAAERKASMHQASSAGPKFDPNKFGWIQGVLVRCILNILGVMLYLRLSWVAGQAGLILGTIIVLLGSTVTTLTALSMSAISTNGEIKGGGAYFMISRSLGPEFGGSIGIIFTIANNVGAAMYIVGFSETIRDLMKTQLTGIGGRLTVLDGFFCGISSYRWKNFAATTLQALQESGASIIDNGQTDVRIISWATAFLLLGIVLAGVSFESKAQIVLLVILSISIVNYVVGTFFQPGLEEQARGVTGYSASTVAQNVGPVWRGEGFFSVFAVYFPAATGIMAGANISGDLKNPQSAIPKGTLLAILITTILYVGGVVLSGSTCLRDASGVMEDLFNGTLTDCARNKSCEFGLLNYFQVMEMESAWGPLITAGIFAATLSSALASLVSAPKILQAVGRDKLYPYLDFFSKGYGKADEPRRGYVLVFCICLGVIAIGDLNAIAPIISNFFLASYALVNYACFDASFSESPGFRPSFKFYNKWVSLVGALLCVAVMFVISWSMALVTFAFILILYMYISRRKPDVNWGSSTQAHSYKSALEKLQKLQSVSEHVKNYRPQILLLTGMPSDRPSLVDFVVNITKKNSLLMCGHVILGDASQSQLANTKTLSVQVTKWLTERKVKGFYYPICAESLQEGVRSLLQAAGIGKLRPNFLLLGYKMNWQNCNLRELINYFHLIHFGFEFNLSVAIFRTTKGFDMNHVAERSESDAGKVTFENRLERISEDEADESGNESESPENSPESIQKDFTAINVEQDVQVVYTKENEDNGKIGAKDETTEETNVQNEHSMSLPQVPKTFNKRIKKATIDVWWLYDDGGLTILIPYLLTIPRSYLAGARLRVFSVASNRNQLDSERESLAALLKKFRIDYKEMFVIPDLNTKPEKQTMKMFNDIIKPYVRNEQTQINGENVYTSDTELQACQEKTNRHLRTRELLLEYSTKSTLVVLTLPIPRKGSVSAYLYLAWLEMLSRDMCPILLIRGNQQSVLTFYS